MPASKMITVYLKTSYHGQNENFQLGSVYDRAIIHSVTGGS